MLSSPLWLAIDAHGLRDPVDVVEERDDLNGVVDGRVRPPFGPQGLDLWPGVRGRAMGQLNREVTQRAHARLELGLAVVVRGVLRQLLCCALGTEVVCMCLNSVVAVVLAGYDDSEQLPLRAAEL